MRHKKPTQTSIKIQPPRFSSLHLASFIRTEDQVGRITARKETSRPGRAAEDHQVAWSGVMPKAVKEKVTRKVKKEKDPNAPKKPLSGYMFFCKDNREAVKEKDPSLKITEIASELGRMWKLLTDEEKKPFQAQAEKDKERYAKEKGE
eukprot:gene7605-758_t